MLTDLFLTAGKAEIEVTNPDNIVFCFRFVPVRVGLMRIEMVPRFGRARRRGMPVAMYDYRGAPSGMTGYYDHGGLSIYPAPNVATDSLRYRVAVWACHMIHNQLEAPHGYRIAHTNKCGRCRRRLAAGNVTGLSVGCERLARESAPSRPYLRAYLGMPEPTIVAA